MSTPESKVKAGVKAFLKKRRIWNFSPVSNGMGVHGIPDIICCWHGLLVAVECKAPGKRNTVTPLQVMQLANINEGGGIGVVIDDPAQMEALERQVAEQIATTNRVIHRVRKEINEHIREGNARAKAARPSNRIRSRRGEHVRRGVPVYG